MRINEALCMEMNFGNEHVVAVVGFMLALLFCKQMLECMHSLLQVWQSCAAYAACCDYGQEHILRGGMLAALPHIDNFLPVHNLASLEQLAAQLEHLDGARPARRQPALQPAL